MCKLQVNFTKPQFPTDPLISFDLVGMLPLFAASPICYVKLCVLYVGVVVVVFFFAVVVVDYKEGEGKSDRKIDGQMTYQNG